MTPFQAVRRPVTTVVRGTGDLLEDIGKQLRFYAGILVDILSFRRVLLKHRSVIFNLVSDVTIGAGALIVGGGMVFVIFSMSFFTGTEVGLQGFKGLEQIGVQSFTGLIGSFANTREVTPIIAGVAFAAQVGAGFTAELGAMRISDEIDALEVMSVPSLVYLVSTRIVALVVALVPLYLVALFASFFGTRFVTTELFGASPGLYDYYFRLYLPPVDIFYSVVKVSVFALQVGLIHGYFGYHASGGPAGVGRAVGVAIRITIITLVSTNLLLSYVFWGSTSTVSLTG